ncbi:hypothetical protein EX30DRAFT_314397, partial [Ascodesmis nigricans]
MIPSPAVFRDTDPRVQDFLQDKFQTLSDLDSLDSLLASVQEHQQQLRSQLNTAESSSASLRTRLSDHSNTLEAAVNSFNARQAHIDRCLPGIASDEAAAAAAELYSIPIEKLRRLDVARAYVALLQEVQSLAATARQSVDAGDPEAALVPYTKLQTLSQGLKVRNDAAEGAAVHILEFVEKTAKGLWSDMKKGLSTDLEELLKKYQWPKEGLDFGAQEMEFKKAFEKLLVLQGPELEHKPENVVLIPLQVLVRPLALRFRFHFEGRRQTNRADKPEWFLSHITNLVTTYSRFMLDHIQPILSQSANPNINQRDAINEFITALLPELRRKINSLLPEITDQAQLLSHFIHELIKFDATMREDFGYAPYSAEPDMTPWKGMTYEVLVVENGFDGWLHVEKEFALARYESIITADDAWEIDYDSVDPADSKPTKSAMRLKDLLETITETYRPLISFSQRLRFLMDIQIAILDQYHDRLSDSIEAFRVLSSTLASYVQGSSKQELESLSGLRGLERLCRVYGSSMYLEDAMRDWNDDIFFLELWEDLTTRSTTTPTTTPLTSDTALFDETATSYSRLRARTETIITDLLTTTLTTDLRAYLRISHWSSTSTSTADTITPELETPLATLSSFSAFLSRALARRVVKRILVAVVAKVEAMVYAGVVVKQQFSVQGGRQLKRDLEEVWRVVGMVLGEEEGGREGKMKGVVRLLTMEVGELRGVVEAVMKGGEEAGRCVESLGLGEGLEVREVREVVGRRVDAW